MSLGLKESRKTIRLAALMKWDRHECIGFLYDFWTMAFNIYENGYLGDVTDPELAIALNLPEDTIIIEHMIKSGYVDREPFRIHNWWKNQAAYFKSKYRRTPEKWQAIEALYEESTSPVPVPAQTKKELKEVKKKVIKEIKKEVQPKPIKIITKKEIAPEAIDLAKFLFKKVKENNPNGTAQEKDIHSWSLDIEKLNRLEKYKFPYGLIKFVLEFSQQDNFWKKQIRSGGKFKAQWDTLSAQSKDWRGGYGYRKTILKADKAATKVADDLDKKYEEVMAENEKHPYTIEMANKNRRALHQPEVDQEEFEKIYGGMK